MLLTIGNSAVARHKAQRVRVKRGVIHIKAVRIHRFGPPEVVVVEDIPKPSPSKGEVLVRVAAAGVAPWDAIIREGKSKVSPQPPLTLGSDLSGFVEEVGPDVSQFAIGDEVYGVTNPQFCGAQAEFAVALAGMIAPKPRRLSHREATSAPVVAVTAWQMLFEYAQAKSGDTILITGAAGNVGAYGVQMALDAGMRVIAVARSSDQELLRAYGVETILDSSAAGFENSLPQVDAVLDTVGGDTVQRCSAAVKAGGRLVSVASTQLPQRASMHSVFFYAEVTSQRLRTVTDLFETRRISARVGSVLPLAEARSAHEMLAGAPHKNGKIVLQLLG
jgi:NADPH:quinone reductase-like Zn-dependent oxidoreductase